MEKTVENMCDTVDREHTVILTAPKIKEYRKSLDSVIIAPFHEENSKGIGYNLSPSKLIYSLKKRTLLEIRHNDEGSYIWIKPHDTILTLSHEYLQIPNNMSGIFHSRVRSVAQGLGNTATTLDPGWKGMILLCVNNPTNKKIRLQITRKIDGTECQCGLITMILWETVGGNQQNNEQVLQLDNPPMRADILSSLVSRPHRLWKNRRYAKFQELVNGLMMFRTENNDYIRRIHDIMGQLTYMETSLYAEQSVKEAKKATIYLRELVTSNENEWAVKDVELKDRFNELNNYMENLKEDIGLNNAESDLKKSISHMHRECEYLILCEKVNQIHKFIHLYTEERWERNTFSNVLCKYVLPCIPVILCTILLLWVLVFGNTLDTESFFSNILISLSPIILSAIVTLISKLLTRK